MYEFALYWDWLSFAVRWLHVIAGIAWIGSSFYFIALDLGLRQRPGLPHGVHGEEWQVHGGGFYHIQKYMVAPDHMPDHLIWFKWESYTTWLSGFALLCVVYYAGADLYLVDPAVLDVPAWGGILISLATIGIGWVIYDLACKSPLGNNDTLLMVVLYGALVVLAYLFTHLFTGRAALLHLGLITGTAMSANVFFVIIPNQAKVVAALKAGETPDPMLGKKAKQRSTHNNYLTLPVLFLMISNHYPLAFATEYNWVIASLVFLMGVTIRHFFNTHHAGKGNPWWTWAVTAALFAAIAWLSTAGPGTPVEDDEAALTPHEERFVKVAAFEDVANVVAGRCTMCHSAEPYWEGIVAAPKGVRLETEAEIARHAREIYLQAGRSHAMPPANATFVEPAERALIRTWYETAIAGS
ncbi:putative membrane protein [Rhodobium orientis]|uniref:Cysteine desulfurase n=1 Tax=Rhodobium orientis TaxID=34017 RepID=A0A327JP38_9HYPH|nr:urate hydroxylase PuuD [Rhodobium orientis]MBB4304960.1 putative membrane protein [Rhodobium orientis]MBK5951279.1 cysteine desulfurase [Rhodobium orientis]RAI27114.1 cysteine desulfurase [Rhodobium orientis]